MDGMLSQDEINALLSGMDVSSTDDSSGAPADSTSESGAGSEIDESLLTATEIDAIGEIANISMGSSATTLYSLVNRKVNITTPVVSLANWSTMIAEYERPCVFIQIKYTVGLDGSNILILKERDVKVITDLMMGGDGTNIDGELGELHLSAISEAMNQMMGSSATSLSTMLGKMIDISPPEASLVDLTELKKPEEIAKFLSGTFCKIAFTMQIEDLVESTILQLYPIEFAKSLYDTFINQQLGVLPVKLPPLRLDIGPHRAAHVGPLVPGEPAAPHGGVDHVHRVGHQTALVGVLDAQDELPPGVAGNKPGVQRRAQIAHVHVPRGGGGEPGADLSVGDAGFHPVEPAFVYGHGKNLQIKLCNTYYIR